MTRIEAGAEFRFMRMPQIYLSEHSKKRLDIAIIFTIAMSISGCASTPHSVNIVDLRSGTQSASRTASSSCKVGFHRVSKGETLYAIAWLHSKDFRSLAKKNNIDSPYVIYPGQCLRLDVPVKSTSGQSQVAEVKATSTAENNKARIVVKTNPPVTNEAEITEPQVVKVVQAAPAASVTKNSNTTSKVVTLTEKVEPKTVAPIKKNTVKKGADSPSNQSLENWRWPAKGKIIAGYSTKAPVNQGIDISGKLGEPVIATAAGQVVYAGSDLAGYGQLILLKHNSSYLSAYAHNKELLVHEGDMVKAGQQIAEIGSTGTTEPKLHFQIRRNGKPVNPIGFLPPR